MDGDANGLFAELAQAATDLPVGFDAMLEAQMAAMEWPEISAMLEAEGQPQGLPGAQGGEEKFRGQVKNFDMNRGSGFIECPEAMQKYGQEVYVHQNVLANSNASVGDIVEFEIHLNAKGLPQAKAPLTVLQSTQPLTYKGTIKSFNEAKGYGFIDCADLKAQYGRDVYLPHSKATGFRVGQEVYFEISINKEGLPVAAEMLPVTFSKAGGKGDYSKGGKGFDSSYMKGGKGGGAWDPGGGKGGGAWGPGGKSGLEWGAQSMGKMSAQAWGTGSKGGGPLGPGSKAGGYKGGGALAPGGKQSNGYDSGYSYGSSYGGKTNIPLALAAKSGYGTKGGGKASSKSSGGGMQLTGTVKSFSQKSGYGFIDCPQVLAEYGRDVFVNASALGDIPVGTVVSFTVRPNAQGMPQADSLAPEGGGSFGVSAASAVAKGAGGGGAGWSGGSVSTGPPATVGRSIVIKKPQGAKGGYNPY